MLLFLCHRRVLSIAIALRTLFSAASQHAMNAAFANGGPAPGLREISLSRMTTGPPCSWQKRTLSGREFIKSFVRGMEEKSLGSIARSTFATAPPAQVA